MKIKPAAVQWGILHKTLSDYVPRGTVDKQRTGPQTIFTQEQESLLVSRIKWLQQIGFPLTRDDIRRMTYEFAFTVGVHC